MFLCETAACGTRLCGVELSAGICQALERVRPDCFATKRSGFVLITFWHPKFQIPSLLHGLTRLAHHPRLLVVCLVAVSMSMRLLLGDKVIIHDICGERDNGRAESREHISAH